MASKAKPRRVEMQETETTKSRVALVMAGAAALFKTAKSRAAVVMVGAAALLAVAAFGFAVRQTITAITSQAVEGPVEPGPSKAAADRIFIGQ